MKILIIYDSFFGNTQKVAEEISKFLSKKHNTVLKNVKDVRKKDYEETELLIVGSPTRAFNPSEKIQEFFKNLDLKNFNFIVFDTRIGVEDIPVALRFLFHLFGYADRRMVKKLKRMSGNELLPSEGFLVKDKEGPLKEGEIEKIGIWLKKL